MKLLSDTTRLRIIMVLKRKELCVCQIMGVLGISQPLASRNLALLSRVGLLKERREGKLVFYSLDGEMPETHSRIIDSLEEIVKSDKILINDIASIRECEDFQKMSGKCDMKTFKEFMNRKKAKKKDDLGG